VPLFHHSDEKPAQASGDGSGTDSVATALEHFNSLSVPERAAELLEKITASLDEDPAAMDQLLGSWLPDTPWDSLSTQQRTDWLSLALILREAFQALVPARLSRTQQARPIRTAPCPV
jgi:hypothetical protein